MLHTKRRWGIAPCEDADELAAKLTEHTWTLCSAFRTAHGTVWVNDSTCEDALQEYGVLRRDEDGTWRQVETITVSWCGREKLRFYIDQADAGAFDASALDQVQAERLEDPHATCALCA